MARKPNGVACLAVLAGIAIPVVELLASTAEVDGFPFLEYERACRKVSKVSIPDYSRHTELASSESWQIADFGFFSFPIPNGAVSIEAIDDEAITKRVSVSSELGLIAAFEVREWSKDLASVTEMSAMYPTFVGATLEDHERRLFDTFGAYAVSDVDLYEVVFASRHEVLTCSPDDRALEERIAFARLIALIGVRNGLSVRGTNDRRLVVRVSELQDVFVEIQVEDRVFNLRLHSWNPNLLYDWQRAVLSSEIDQSALERVDLSKTFSE